MTNRTPEQTAFPSVVHGGIAADRLTPFRAISALILREMSATYGRNPGGYIWALVEPLGAILVLTIAFQFISRTPPIGNNFMLFYATAYPIFQLYTSTTSKVQGALTYSRALLAYPRIIWLDAVLARFLLNAATSISVMVIIWTGILHFTNAQATLDIPPILNAILIVLLLGLGIGMINSIVIGIFPVWASAWSILNRPMFVVSGIFILYENFPPVAQSILWWNPVLHATGLVRRGFYATYEASYVSLVYCYGVAFVLIAIGLICMRGWHKLVLEK